MPSDPGTRDLALLLDMLLAASDALEFLQGLDQPAFEASRLHQAAVIRCIEIIGEAANRVSPDFRTRHPEIAWKAMAGMRHRLIHGYAEVRLDLVWRAAQADLPALTAALNRLVATEQPKPGG
jgi:uncharacterized protein with HEPN domain